MPQYYVHDSHEGIITDEVFEIAQIEMQRRRELKTARSSAHFFSGRIICGCCGESYTRHVWHSNSKYRRYIWRCGNKYKRETPCSTRHVTEDEIKKAFIQKVNELLSQKEELLQTCKEIVQEMLNTDRMELRLKSLQDEVTKLYAELSKHVKEAGVVLDESDEQREKFDRDFVAYEEIQTEVRKLTEEISDVNRRHIEIGHFITSLSRIKENIKCFDEELWIALVEVAVILKEDKTVMFRLRSGVEKYVLK